MLLRVPDQEVSMASPVVPAVLEVALDVRVTVKLEAENATEEELIRHVTRHGLEVAGAIAAIVGACGSNPEAGWLDEDRCAYVTDVVAAEPSQGGALAIIELPVVIR